MYDGVGEVLATGGLRSVFQPLVRLEDQQVIGFEALSRGPAGHPLESPMALLDAARAAGRLGELDWACRASAIRSATGAGLDPGLSWFVNVEPESLTTPCPPEYEPDLAATDRLRVVVELTERALVHDPAELFATVDRVRSSGWGVALDDVGADPASLALLPFLDPDVVKLDMRLVSRHMDRDVAAVATAVRAHAEATGATILAEGIETERDVLVAQALGASYGQGWFFGRPGPLPERTDPVTALGLAEGRGRRDERTPFEVVSAVKAAAVTQKRLLRPISRHLEDQAISGGVPMVILGCFQHARFFTPRIAGRYARLAAATAFTAAFGIDLAAEPAPGVRGALLDEGDRLVDEWNVLVVGPHYAGALVARDLGDTGPDDERRFEYVVTHDRALVLDAARSLFGSVAPSTSPQR